MKFRLNEADIYIIQTVLNTLPPEDVPEAFRQFTNIELVSDKNREKIAPYFGDGFELERFNVELSKEDDTFLKVLILLIVDFQDKHITEVEERRLILETVLNLQEISKQLK